MAKQKREYFKIDFCNIVKFDCKCGRRYINTSNCRQCTYSTEKQTNADRIRSMSNEELAEFLCKVKADYQCVDHEFPSDEECGEWEEWLKSESK